MPRKHDDSGILSGIFACRHTICNWKRYLARDPPSYDSGTLLSEADAKAVMDKIEARSKTMMDKIEARRVREEYEKGTIARKHDDRGFPRLQVHEVPSYIAQRWNRYLARDPPSQTIWDWKRYLARDPPSYDSGTLLSEADAETMMDKIEARSKWLKAKQWLKGLYEKGTIAGDDPKVFREKYRFLPHRETETNLRNIDRLVMIRDCLLYTSDAADE